MNQGYEYRAIVGPEAAGRTVLEHLVDRYRHSDADAWRQRIARGEVRLDEAPAAASDRLGAGQSLVWRRPPWEEPRVPLAFGVLFHDAHLLGVAKPRGLPTVPNGGFLTHTLLHLVRARAPAAVPMHRLGRGTSGVVLFALSPPGRRSLARAWREGRVEKTYRALVSGVPRREAFSIDAPIGLVAHPRLGRVHAAAPVGRSALSHVRVLGLGESSALVEVKIPTGRPHQIRIHLAAAGHPLVGDPLYGVGGVPRAEPGLPGDPGYWLHAERLRVEHPASGEWLEIECAPPRILRLDARSGPEYPLLR
jgi:23S rRNA pseudouridine1911/1915/1917 synthase